MAGGEHVPLMYTVYRITAGNGARTQAFQTMTGTGTMVVVLPAGSAADLLKYYKETYLPAIEEPSLRISRFFFPLLDLKSLQGRKSEDLSRWLGSVHLYMRESPQDRGILIIADKELGPALKQAGARVEGEGKWSIP
jgi:hypothetical protein